jgi:hypothetical protein
MVTTTAPPPHIYEAQVTKYDTDSTLYCLIQLKSHRNGTVQIFDTISNIVALDHPVRPAVHKHPVASLRSKLAAAAPRMAGHGMKPVHKVFYIEGKKGTEKTNSFAKHIAPHK